MEGAYLPGGRFSVWASKVTFQASPLTRAFLPAYPLKNQHFRMPLSSTTIVTS